MKTVVSFLKAPLLLLVAALMPSVALAEDTCSLSKPPANAAVTAVHGYFYFVYPPSIPKAFSGCQIMWDEAGRAAIVLRFERGTLTKATQTDPSNDSRKEVCTYGKGALRAGSSTDCPEYDAVKKGVQHLGLPQGLVVPRDRDARLKRTSPK